MDYLIIGLGIFIVVAGWILAISHREKMRRKKFDVPPPF